MRGAGGARRSEFSVPGLASPRPEPQYSTKTHDVTVDLSSATCHLESLGSGSLSSDPGQGVAGQITGISVSCSAHVHARLDIWPHPSCSFDLDGSVGGGSASLVLDITDNGGHPELVAKSIDVNVGDFDIHFHGGEPDPGTPGLVGPPPRRCCSELRATPGSFHALLRAPSAASASAGFPSRRHLQHRG